MAVTTAGDIVRKALGLILYLGQQDTVSSGDEQEAFDALNLMLESLRLERLACFAQRQQNFPLTSGTATYTVGPSGTFNTDRPIKLIDAFVLHQTVRFPIRLVSQQQMNGVSVPSIQGMPSTLFYDPQIPLGSITLYPVPFQAGMQLYFTSYLEIQSFASTTDLLALPPGYKKMLIFNLAVDIAPSFGRPPTPEILRGAMQSKAAVKRINQQQVTASFDSGLTDRANQGMPYGWWVNI